MIMPNYLDQIAKMHENALIAWDRDGMQISQDSHVNISVWNHESCWSMYPTAGRHCQMTGGLGCVQNLLVTLISNARWGRQVLYLCPEDPLGVRWYRDPDAM